MIREKFLQFKASFRQYSRKEVRQFFIHENPNDLITYLSDQVYFKDHFCWNERLSEKHIPYMLENNIQIEWYPLSVSEEMSFHYIMKTWRRRHLGLYHDWSVGLLSQRSDLTAEFKTWLLNRNVGWRYDYFKLSKAKPKPPCFSPRPLPFRTELLYMPPYDPSDPFAKPVFRHLHSTGFEWCKNDFLVRSEKQLYCT